MEDTLAPIPHTFSRMIEAQKKLLVEAAEEATKKLEYDSAHDEEILAAIAIVEKFLGAKNRVCYGGQAINAHLPLKHRFYDPNTTIPDYDFLTPDRKADIEALTTMFKKEGFTEIGVRPGIHEGTTKIYVNFVAVADVTEINPLFYTIISRRSIKKSGISYMDPNTLRMMMYLELSRPRGEVGRWEKVFERLTLLNIHVPLKGCKMGTTKKLRSARLPAEIRSKLLDYIVSEHRILCGGDVIDYYADRIKSNKNPIHWLLGGRSPLIFYSEDPAADVTALQGRTDNTFTFKKFEAVADFFPPIYIGYIRGTTKPVVAIIQTTACHSYNSVTLQDGRRIFLASFDTLATLYLSFLFRSTLETFFGKPILCLVEKVIHLQASYREKKDGPFPFISIECAGHQKTFQSLLREKVARIKKERGAPTRTLKKSQAKSKSRSQSRSQSQQRSLPMFKVQKATTRRLTRF